MTNHAELIAEAEAIARWMMRRGFPDWAQVMEECAAALRECAVPEGWRVTEYTDKNGRNVRMHYQNEWWTTSHNNPFPTASAAMADLDGEGK